MIVVEPNAGRRAKAAELGFETVDPGAGDPVEAIRGMTGGLGVDVVLECAGVPVTVQWALGMLRRGGRCAAVGIPTVGVEIAMQRLVLDELELVGCRASGGRDAPRHAARRAGPDARPRDGHPPLLAEPSTSRRSPPSTIPKSGAIKIVILP